MDWYQSNRVDPKEGTVGCMCTTVSVIHGRTSVLPRREAFPRRHATTGGIIHLIVSYSTAPAREAETALSASDENWKIHSCVVRKTESFPF